MGKETKIGLGVIAALLVVFAVVLTLRLTNQRGDGVASAETEESSAEAKGKDVEKVNPGFAFKPSATRVKAAKPQLLPLLASHKKTAASKTSTSQLLTFPKAPVPDNDTSPRSSAGWATTGGHTRVQLGTPSHSELSGLVLDPPTTQQSNALTPSRYGRRLPSPSSQTLNHQPRRGQSNYQSISTSRGGGAPYNSGGYRQGYGSKHDYDTRSTYAGQHTITRPPITPRQSASALRRDGSYEVQPNDSYWLISKRLYGSGAYFKALAELNRREHPVADQLRVGDSISTPGLAKLVDSFPDLCPSPQRQKILAKRANVVSVSAQYGSQYGGGSTYTVEEGDTLYDIARYEMGDASRWVEILQLNQRVLQGDFDYVVPGMKLVMPRGASDSLTRRPEQYQSPSRNSLRR